ncbi:MAG: ComF family protein [Clostridia bacterium]|nr:ComF family protein [Clostridia bacterium]
MINLFYRQPVCIICENRIHKSHTHVMANRLCICKSCYNKLYRIPIPSQGTKHTKYVLSPFYYKGGYREAILKYKFSGSHAYALVFAKLMSDFIKDIDDICTADMIVAVPISQERLNERGFNQTQLILDCMKDELSLNYRQDVLIRSKDTEHQSRLSGYERFKNVKDAFLVSGDVKNMRIVVFDDVYTTGNTMEACAKALIDAGAKEVIALTLAEVVQKSNDTGAEVILYHSKKEK